MELSQIVKRGSEPVWLWACAKRSDLPWIKSDGLVPLTGLTYLVQSRNEAFPNAERLTMRINARSLDRSLLARDDTWRSWVEGRVKEPPRSLLSWWVRAGVCRDEPTRKALHTQIVRINPGRVWTYSGVVPPEAISVASESGFYVSLKPGPLRVSQMLREPPPRTAEDTGQTAPSLAQLFPPRAFNGWTTDSSTRDSVVYSKTVGNVDLARFRVEYVGPQVTVQVQWPLSVGSLDCGLDLLQAAGKYTFETTYPNVEAWQQDLAAVKQLAWSLGSANLKTAAARSARR